MSFGKDMNIQPTAEPFLGARGCVHKEDEGSFWPQAAQSQVGRQCEQDLFSL